ncbi:hypothetical protein BH24GEM3_BH24GEM3_27910 [soil metagenome]|nr:hypothetical protein [Gemmatimonadota bacterium]
MRIPWLNRLLLVTIVAVAAACVSSRAGGSASGYDPDRITPEEVAATTATIALEVVERLRPQWLRSRGPDSFRTSSRIVVYVNGQPQGGIAVLRQLPINTIRELQYLNGTIATQRFGTGHGAGVILVQTR